MAGCFSVNSKLIFSISKKVQTGILQCASIHICFAISSKMLELHRGDGLRLPFQEAAIFMHLVNLNEKLPGQQLSTLAGQHNAGKMVFMEVPTLVRVFVSFNLCMCVS